MKGYMIRLLAACVFLWMAAIPDLIRQKIPLWIPGAFFAGAFLAEYLMPYSMTKQEMWMGTVPGTVLLLLSLPLQGKLGEGDGICLAVCGLYTGMTAATLILEIALIMAALTGGVSILAKKRKCGDRIAFIPFLAAAGSLLMIAETVRAVYRG